jgi:hypothetical protein
MNQAALELDDKMRKYLLASIWLHRQFLRLVVSGIATPRAAGRTAGTAEARATAGDGMRNRRKTGHV